MRLRTRFILLGIWILVFLITTPVIVLFALGYKFDLQTGQITKTGSLIARTNPEGADIYIDDKLQKSQTNATVRFLLPGDYNIQLSKDGYQSWTKRLNVRSALVTWAAQEREFITLFYSHPETLSQNNFDQAAVLSSYQNAITVNGSSASAYNASENVQEIFDITPKDIANAQDLNQNALHYYLRRPHARIFNPEFLTASTEIQSNDRYAALLMSPNLYVSQNGTAGLHAEGVSGFLLEGDHLWFAQKNALYHQSLISGALEKITELPYAPTKAQIIRGNSQIFLILDGTAYALNDKLEEIYRGISTAYWDGVMQRLVLNNNNEALLFDPQSFRSELVIRSSTVISNVITNPTTGYMFFINEGKVKAIELDGRDHRNVYTIAEGDPQAFILGDNGRLLTIYGKSQRQVLRIR
jgi:hypothetical protein